MELSKQLILFRYILSQFGYEEFNANFSDLVEDLFELSAGIHEAPGEGRTTAEGENT